MNYASHDKIDLRHVYVFQKCLKIHQLNIIQIIKTTKKHVKDIKFFLKKEKKKSNNMVVKAFEYRKKYYKLRKNA